MIGTFSFSDYSEILLYFRNADKAPMIADVEYFTTYNNKEASIVV